MTRTDTRMVHMCAGARHRAGGRHDGGEQGAVVGRGRTAPPGAALARVSHTRGISPHALTACGAHGDIPRLSVRDRTKRDE